MTDYIATRWYRPPEVLLGTKEYGTGIDMWAVGCILGELLNRRPVFPGKDTPSQLRLIFHLIGTPPESELAVLKTAKSRLVMEDIGVIRGQGFQRYFPNANPLAIDLMKKLMTFHPSDRYTVEQALEHPYLHDFYLPDDEPISNVLLANLGFEFDRTMNSRDVDFKKEVYNEILMYHFPDTSNKENERPI